eukprot:719664-Prymnesium_polylepis.1
MCIRDSACPVATMLAPACVSARMPPWHPTYDITACRQVTALKGKGAEAIVVVYAPWCQFCQAMEEEYTKVAEVSGLPTYKFR